MRAVNLLTPELRSAQKGSSAPRPSALETSGGIGAFALLGALVLCVAAVAGSALAGNTVKDRTATLAAVNAKNDATVKHAAELKPYADFQTVANERIGTVHALANARFDWEQALRDLSRALPSNVYVSSMAGDVGSGSGGAGSGIRSAIPAPAIELSGCTRSQPAVATLMSRLRNIQGVTRVSLAKSEKAESVAAGTAGTTPCGKGTPPTFDVVVFFEKATVGAALTEVTKTIDPAKVAATPAAGKDGKDGKDATKGGTP
jgi:Tfp pilus assembly protein PilN